MESHGLRTTALKAIDKTIFYPSKAKERLKSMIETRPDWCVSRQRVWGVPLPIFISKKDDEIVFKSEITNKVTLRVNLKTFTITYYSGDHPQNTFQNPVT